MAADSDGESHTGFTTILSYLSYKSGTFSGRKVRQLPGACEEDNDLIQTVFTCHGNLDDPDFPQRFSHLLDQLSKILTTEKDVLMQRVKKVEPWNSVRVTLTIPREAASRLRALAAAGDSALHALGILSVQLEGDQVISLRLTNQFGGEPQEIVLRTSASTDTAAVSSVDNTANITTGPVSTLLQSIPGPSGTSSNGFPSPNVVAPAASAVIPPSPRPHSGPPPFPFTSMTHAAQTQQSRQDSPHHTFTPPPPPYTARSFTPPLTRPVQAAPAANPAAVPTPSSKPNPVVDTTVSLASPLLVNLLQTDGKDIQGTEPRPRPPAALKPRPRPLTKTLSQRVMAPRFPAAVAATAPVQRFPPATIASVTTASTTTTSSSRALRPAFAAASNQPRSVLHGYSQFTALSSKPCSLTETKDASEEKNNTNDGKKLIINPLTGEMEPMVSESSDSEDGVVESLVSNSISPKNSFSDDDSMLNRFSDTSDESEMPSKPNGPDIRRRPSTHKPGTVATVPINPHHAPEKIKLIKIKPEPGSAPASAYKVESFAPDVARKAVASPGGRSASLPNPVSSAAVIPVPAAPTISSAAPLPLAGVMAMATATVTAASAAAVSEEPRVPPLHISLRGRNATVVSSKKKTLHWLSDDEDAYSKLPKKKSKLGNASVKDGRDCIAINSDLMQTQKPKRAKIKRLLGTVEEGLKLKIPVMADLDIGDLCDEKLNKKRKDSKKLKNNLRHSDSDGDTKVSLKVDSKEWISRTLKEETLRHSVSITSELDEVITESERVESHAGSVSGSGGANASGDAGGGGGGCGAAAAAAAGDVETAHAVAENLTEPTALPAVEPGSRTSALKPGNLELSELLRCKKLDSNNKKLDCLKIKNKMFVESTQANDDNGDEEPTATEMTSIKKPQEIGGKIKSELSSKIDRVSGKLKSDLSKDGINKKKLDEVGGKGLKAGARTKCVKKDGVTARLVVALSAEPEPDELAFNRAKRRHSGDQSVPESQAQKVKRSSSSDQPSPITKLPLANRRFDVLSRKIRKDYVIDRLRKDKMGKVVPVNAKLNNPAADANTKKIHNRAVGNNGAVKSVDVLATTQALTVLPQLDDVKPVLTRLEADPPDKLKDSAGVEGNTQGEDSGIESMDALSEKSPNQGESPCRKEDSKEMDEGKKGQNHDRTDEDDVKELNVNSCLTIGNSNQDAHQPQAHSVPFDCSSQNNNSAEPEPETSTKLSETANDGLIDSFEIKIREAFRRDEDLSREGLGAKILEGSSKEWTKKPKTKTEHDGEPADASKETKDASVDDDKQSSSTDSHKEWPKENSPSLEDMERFRVNPPLYTYAKREDSLSPSPTATEDTDHRNHMKDDETGNKIGNATQTPSKTEETADETSSGHQTPGRCLRNKSLLEQLLIEIPEDSRRTRSWNKLGSSPGETPKSSPRANSPTIARPSPRSTTKQSPTPRTSKRPSKRKCSENAAELIKACMGVEDGKSSKAVTNATSTQWKKGDVESSDDEPLSDLARSREHSVEQDAKPNALRTKLRQMVEDESRNNNKVSVKVVTEPPTRRSVRQTQGSLNKTLRPVASDGRSVRSTRSQETCETGNKRRRASRDGK